MHQAQSELLNTWMLRSTSAFHSVSGSKLDFQRLHKPKTVFWAVLQIHILAWKILVSGHNEYWQCDWMVKVSCIDCQKQFQLRTRNNSIQISNIADYQLEWEDYAWDRGEGIWRVIRTCPKMALLYICDQYATSSTKHRIRFDSGLGHWPNTHFQFCFHSLSIIAS